MDTRYYLAVDIGASSGRHMLSHMENGKMVLEEIYCFPNDMTEKAGHKVWDVDRLFEEILTGMKKCLEMGKIPHSMGIDTWTVDFVLLDENDKMFGDAVAYRDDRTKDIDKAVCQFVSETELYTKQFDWEKMWAIADHITDGNAIRAKAEDILATFDIAPDKDNKAATVETVWNMAKYVVAFEEWVKEEELGMIASHYDGFARGIAGKRDSMLIPAFSMLIKQGTACAVEGDMKVAMAMSILKTISGTGQLSEIYSIYFNEDICIIGHSGSGDADISQAKKPTMKIVDVFHGKTSGGYLTQFYPPVGAVTYLGITQDMNGKFKFVVAEGVNEDGPIFTFGDTNMRTRFSIGAREFCNHWSEAGPTHHMAAAAGRHIIQYSRWQRYWMCRLILYADKNMVKAIKSTV